MIANMTIKYKSAPISEFICGIIFNGPLLTYDILFRLIRSIQDEYPEIHNLPPIFEEELIKGKISINMNFNTSGNSVFRLFNKDKTFLVQLQQNFILLNWRRDDIDTVGNYPGYKEIYQRFTKIFEMLNKLITIENSMIKSYSLHYLDRIFWKDYINNLSEINALLNMSIPHVTDITNIQTKFGSEIKKLGGYSFITINSSETNEFRNPILNIEFKIKGKTDDKMDTWFDEAHKHQILFFEKLINKEILQQWK